MTDITKQLEEFSKKHQLWDLAMSKGRISLERHFNDEPQDCTIHFGEHKVGDIQFVRRKQQLIFKKGSDTVFIISTFYSLVLENKSVDYGYYALDVDMNGKPVDDWLVFK